MMIDGSEQFAFRSAQPKGEASGKFGLLASFAAFLALTAFQPQNAWAEKPLLLQLHLQKADLASEGRMNIHGFVEGGQFEELLKPSSIPVEAPRCRGAIIARMPGTNPSSPNAQAVVAAKRELFEEFEALKSGHQSFLDVVVDAAPYGKVLPGPSHRIKLSECNVFFAEDKHGLIKSLGK